MRTPKILDCTSRYLITTADELTWKFDRPVIFLGEWCRLYDRKHVWQEMDGIVAAPYGLGKSHKDKDFNEARALEEKLFPVLCKVLNRQHGTQHGERFWRIVLGHWLRRYVNVMLNRVKTLEQCFQVHQISGTTVYANNHYSLVRQDSLSATVAFSDERWNNALIARILNFLGVENCLVEVHSGYESASSDFNGISTAPTLKRTVLKWGYKQVGKLTRCLMRDNDAFIINSYLPIKEAIKLELALGQCPQIWRSPKIEVSDKHDRGLRERLAKLFVSKSGNNLEYILFAMVFELLPSCYLEGFSNLNTFVKQQPWPKSPKFIFTSNNFDFDEVFKLWAATKAESGSKYYSGQHGSNYGTHRYLNDTVEEVTADNFFTWGWADCLPQHTTAFVFTTAGRKAKYYNPQGGLLLIELHLEDRVPTWDVTSEHINYFEDQQNFVSDLTIMVKQNLTIRLHPTHRDSDWNEEARWQAFDPVLKIDTGGTPIRELIAESRLVVHSYDSTGILETLSQNIPTLAFWRNDLDHLRESAKPYYQLLVDAGIVHLTAESVAQKVNEVWDDVDDWWGQGDVQDAREKFCTRYARKSQKPIRELKQIIKSIT